MYCYTTYKDPFELIITGKTSILIFFNLMEIFKKLIFAISNFQIAT